MKTEHRDIDVYRIFDAIWRRKRFPILSAVAAVFICAIALYFVTPQYTVSMSVAPPGRIANETASYGASPGRGLASLVTFHQSDEVFEKFQALLTSARLARDVVQHPSVLKGVFRNEWDPRTQRWRPPPGMLTWLNAKLASAFHFPAWRPPGAEALAAYLDKHLRLSRDRDTGVLTISLKSADPAFTQKLLSLLYSGADAILRTAARDRVEKQIGYIDRKLGSITVAEQKAALIRILSSEERLAIVIEPDIPYSAEVLDPPHYSMVPSFPRPKLYLALAAILGLLIGAVIAVLVNARQEARRAAFDETEATDPALVRASQYQA